MDIQQEIQSLLERGLRFSIETNGVAVSVWVGDYVRQQAAAVTLTSIEQAIDWLRRYGTVPATA